MAVIVEAEAVDHCIAFDNPENPRSRISRLRTRCDSSDLGEAEAEPQQCIRHLAILVETGCNADRIGEIEPGQTHIQARIGSDWRCREKSGFQRPDGEAVRLLRIKAEQAGSSEIKQVQAPISAGNMCLPVSSSGKVSIRIAQSSGMGA